MFSLVTQCLPHSFVVYTLHSESRCAPIKGVGGDVHEHLYRPETFKFIRKHTIEICVQKVAVHL
jgi:hypothetical protein